MVGVGMRVGLLERLVAVKVWPASSAGPALIPARFTVCTPASSLKERLPKALSVGASFTALTVTVKVLVTALTPPLAVPPLSVTTTVMTAVPLLLAAGVNCNEPVALGLV